MILEPKPGRYRLHRLDSPEAEAVLAERGVTRADLDRALAELERTEGIRVRSIVGINHDAVFGSRREGWHPDLPDACKEPFVPLLWLKVLELLGRVPAGSTARFLREQRCPTDGRHLRRGCAPGGDLFERLARGIESNDLLAVPLLPTQDAHVHVLRVEFHQLPGARDQGRAEPPNGSKTMSRDLLEFRTARSTSATGFMVGCKSFRGLVENQTSPWSRAPHQYRS